MGFWILLSLLCSGYCLYKIHELGTSNKHEATKEEAELEPIIYERLQSLVGKTCEITMKRPMIFIDLMNSLKGTVIDVDEQWVVMLGKKDMQYVIRLTTIKEVTQIL